jgi:hypothetical protein
LLSQILHGRDNFVGATLFAEAVMTFNKSVHSQKTGTGLEERLKSGTGLDKLEKPLPTNELGNHIVVTYQRLRLGMGFIALFFR